MNPPPSFNDQLERIEPSALESMHRAEFDVQIATAKRYPRKLGLVKQDMLSFATLDQETAESCFYTLPRGGKNIQGPSVRLAEIAVSCYGNLRVGSRVIATVTDGQNPHVVIQSVCHDLEKNVAVTMEKRRRITKKKSKDYIDEDDINLAANAGAAIAFRDAVFKVVPLALIKPVYEQAKSVAIGDAKTLVDRRARMVDAFGKMGVSKDMILARLEKKTLDDVGLGDMETLIGLHTALKDGETTIDEVFTPAKAAAPKFEAPKASDVNNPTMGAGVADAIAKQISEKAALKTIAEPPPQPKPAPEPATPTPAPTPAPPTPPAEQPATPKRNTKPKPEAPPGAKKRLIDAGVSFDDFTDWCVNTGRAATAKEWLYAATQAEKLGAHQYDHVPDAFWTALALDDTGVGKAITLYGTTTETTPQP